MKKEDKDFYDLLDSAVAAFNDLTPEQQAAHRREQAISFVYGNTKLSNPSITREMVERMYDSVPHHMEPK